MSNYENVMQRFGLNPNLPNPEFPKKVTTISEAERLFLLSEKKWNIDHDSLEVPPKETEEKPEEENHEEL
jgi:hypothetical protein